MTAVLVACVLVVIAYRLSLEPPIARRIDAGERFHDTTARGEDIVELSAAGMMLARLSRRGYRAERIPVGTLRTLRVPAIAIVDPRWDGEALVVRSRADA
jgi:hypothetical protein